MKLYGLRHGFAGRKALDTPIAMRTTARFIGHDVHTHMKQYDQWIDDQDKKKEVNATHIAMATHQPTQKAQQPENIIPEITLKPLMFSDQLNSNKSKEILRKNLLRGRTERRANIRSMDSQKHLTQSEDTFMNAIPAPEESIT